MSEIETAIPAEFRDPAYRHRRFQNWMIVGLLYSFFYMTRYNLSAMAPTLQEVFGWTSNDLGLLDSLLPLGYFIGLLFNAPIADKFGGRKAFLVGAIGVVLMNTAFGACSMAVLKEAAWTGSRDARSMVEAATFAGNLTARDMAWIMAILWAVNGYFQSFGALSIVKINAQWFHLRERGTFGAIFGVLIRFGLILANSVAPFIANYLPWQWAFLIPAGCVFILFFLNLFFVVETPEHAGFSPRDTGDAVIGEEGQKVTIWTVIKTVITSWHMWMIALASMMIGFVRRSAVDGWWQLYCQKAYGITKSDFTYHLIAWGIAILGIIGGFAFGIMSDRVYKGRRAPVVVFGFVGMAVTLGLFNLSDGLALGAVGTVICLVLLSFFVNGSHGMIGGAASMDFGGRKAAGTAAGLFDGMQYLAGFINGLTVGWITNQPDGWIWWKLWPIPFALVGAVVMAMLWNVTPRGKAGGH